MERIMTFFTNWWVPATGLTPTINIWEQTWVQRVSDGVLSELAWGFYIYEFQLYDVDKVYAYQIDWGNSLSNGDRYKFGNNQFDSYANKIAWGRTAAPITELNWRLEDIKKSVKNIKFPTYDDSEIKSSLTKLHETVSKPVVDWVSPVLLELQNQIRDIKSLVDTLSSNDSIAELWESLNQVKDWLSTHILWLEKNVSSLVQKSIDNVLSEIKPIGWMIQEPVQNLSKQIDDKVTEILANKIPENIKWMYEVVVQRNKDAGVLKQLEELEIWDESALQELLEILPDNEG